MICKLGCCFRNVSSFIKSSKAKFEASKTNCIQTGSSRTTRPRGGLKKDHAVKDCSRHQVPRFERACLSFQTSSRTSSKNSPSSSSFMPLCST